jgi:hypothetical protein
MFVILLRLFSAGFAENEGVASCKCALCLSAINLRNPDTDERRRAGCSGQNKCKKDRFIDLFANSPSSPSLQCLMLSRLVLARSPVLRSASTRISSLGVRSFSTEDDEALNEPREGKFVNTS